jgi:hypothetical protein
VNIHAHWTSFATAHPTTNAQAGLVEAAQKGTLTHWDSDGKITNALEQQKRSGDPEKVGQC